MKMLTQEKFLSKTIATFPQHFSRKGDRQSWANIRWKLVSWC